MVKHPSPNLYPILPRLLRQRNFIEPNFSFLLPFYSFYRTCVSSPTRISVGGGDTNTITFNKTSQRYPIIRPLFLSPELRHTVTNQRKTALVIIQVTVL